MRNSLVLVSRQDALAIRTTLAELSWLASQAKGILSQRGEEPKTRPKEVWIADIANAMDLIDT